MTEDEISLRHLKTLSLLLELRSLTRVGEVLGTNQPAVSKVLSKLRRYFGDPLFVRVGSSMNPTPRALEIAAPLRNLLAGSERLRSSRTSFDPKTSHREFKVIVSEVGMMTLIPTIVRELDRAGSRLRLHVVPLDVGHVASKLESGEGDVALGSFPKQSGMLRRQKLHVDSYVSIVRKDHPRFEKLSKITGFLQERQIIVSASGAGQAVHRQLEDAVLSKINPELIQLRVSSFVACAFVASQTDAVGMIPKTLSTQMARSLPISSFTPPLVLPRIEISQLWHERVDRDAGHRWLRKLIYKLHARSVERET